MPVQERIGKAIYPYLHRWMWASPSEVWVRRGLGEEEGEKARAKPERLQL